jgi:DNA-binding Xre family transcriptional regulator
MAKPRKQSLSRAGSPFPNRLRQVRLARGQTIEQLAESAGMSVSAVHRLETGETELRPSKLGRLTEALQADPTEILPGRVVHVVGYIGAGAEIYPFDDHAPGDGLREAHCPAGMDPRRTVAVEIRGDSMAPIADGWLAFYTRDPDYGPSDFLGHLCVVKLTDGRMLLKSVRRGYAPGRFNLLSTNAAMIEDAELEWAAPVRAFLPPGAEPIN